MPRPRTVDRQAILEAAVQVLMDGGVTSLSFGSVATSAGVSKATVQSIFGTRERLIESMLERWAADENARLGDALEPGAASRDRLATHIRLTGEEVAEVNTRVAAMLAVLAGSGESSQSVIQWYRDRIGDLSVGDALGDNQRLAFLAAEGALFLRYLVGFPVRDDIWSELFEELAELASR